MKQHNHWKMKQLQTAIVKIVLWGFGLLLLFLVLVLKRAVNYSLVSGAVSFILLTLGLGLYLLETVIWKTPIMNLPIWENYWTPVLEGRWEGILVREGVEHPFIIEIKQSFTSISCITYSKHSSSSAYATEILYDEQLKNYQLIYYWHGKTTNVSNVLGDSDSFEGFTILKLVIESHKVASLTGEYFTNRQPKQTKGTIDLKTRQKELKNAF